MMRTFLFAAIAALLLAGCSQNARKTKAQHMKLSADTAGASAYILGKRYQLPHEFKMKPGDYLFRIEKPGYATVWFSCRVREDGVYAAGNSPDGSLFWKKMQPAAREIALKPRGSSVLIIGKPKRAEVVEGDKVLGSTPLVLTNQSIGRHEAQLRCANYAEQRIVWNIRDARPVMIQAELTTNIGELRLTSEPSAARVFIDGKLCGQSPFRGPLVIGKHSIRLEMDGFLPAERFVSIQVGKTTTEEFTLNASPGGMIITSDPPGAKVSINGEHKGSTPLTLNDLEAGDYDVAVALPGCDPEKRTVKVAPGSITRELFTLSSSSGGIALDIFPAGVSVYVNNKPCGVVKQREGRLQTELLYIHNLSPGVYQVKVMHKRAATETRRVVVKKGKITRPPRIELWVPNAEVTFVYDGHTETGMIYSETEDEIRFGSSRGIITSIKRSEIKSITMLDSNE